MNSLANDSFKVSGSFVKRGSKPYYVIGHVERMPTFFMSLISSDDHWLFLASNGGLTAGRVSPESALFPYTSVDNIYTSSLHTGPRTLIRAGSTLWEPFNPHTESNACTTRNLYRHWLGHEIVFEEINDQLGLSYSYSWRTSPAYGFVRTCRIENLSGEDLDLEILDGLQNILPAGTPRQTQSVASNLVDAYKLSEIDQQSSLGLYRLYSAITDRAEPAESLLANTVFSLGSGSLNIYLDDQIEAFKRGYIPKAASFTRGIRGHYMRHSALSLKTSQAEEWMIIANVEQSSAKVLELKQKLENKEKLAQEINADIELGESSLKQIMASADGFQLGADEMVLAHHYSNTVFNVFRGGIFHNGYEIDTTDFRKTIANFNSLVSKRNASFLEGLPAKINYSVLMELVTEQNDPQLSRLACEYLPITFGRRHGDPSRPWNQFRIDLKDDAGNPKLSYEGNWRDIFQNWEALCISYPMFIGSVIAKFVNASTADGYNPYRITKQGIDWEIEDPEDPWSYIGYWGDHQIIYLLKLLELARDTDPDGLLKMLKQNNFCYANVPYKLATFEKMQKDSKDTVSFDNALAKSIESRLETIGADGKLILDSSGEVYQVSLSEKLLVTLLAKLSNLVLNGGIWLNTQRPEWNDANNALVGQGLSVVTLCYLYRYIEFLSGLLDKLDDEIELSTEVSEWLLQVGICLESTTSKLDQGISAESLSFEVLSTLGQSASAYRQKIYQQKGFSGRTILPIEAIFQLLDSALNVVRQSVLANRREDGLFHAYNTLKITDRGLDVQHLYPMLEGQVAILSTGILNASESASVLEALYQSAMYRADQKTFLLYPDKKALSFSEKNHIDEDQWRAIKLLQAMSDKNDQRLCEIDSANNAHFNAAIKNASDLECHLIELEQEYAELVVESKDALLALYEKTFEHQSFTGRSGGMFGFEGLGCVYWHMVGKLLVAVQESWRNSLERGEPKEASDQLAEFYYRVRDGIGFNKSPQEYGAFPMDAYSHTPSHSGAQQPGMTGQVKEEILTRFGELGVRYDSGRIHIEPKLLRENELLKEESKLRYLDTQGHWSVVSAPKNSIAFTLCQVPFILEFTEGDKTEILIEHTHGDKVRTHDFSLPEKISFSIMNREGLVKYVYGSLSKNILFNSVCH